MKMIAYFKGFLFGIVLSGIIPMILMIFGQLLAGGLSSLWGESWLYFAFIVPFTANAVILTGYFHSSRDIAPKKMWLISVISAVTVSLYTGTIGTITGEAIVRGGFASVNMEDTLQWGPIYAALLLPISIPLCWLLNGILKSFVK